MQLWKHRTRAERVAADLGLASGILMYHRVARESHDPWDLCVTPEHFAEQLEVLRRRARCVPLGDIVCRWRQRPGQVRIAVTFDDGYRGNLKQALPLLERFDVPATVFVSSGFIGSGREFWWDALERCLLRPRSLPAVLQLRVAGEERSWAVASEPGDAESGTWRADRTTARTARQRLFLELWELLVVLEAKERERALDELVKWSGVEPHAPAESLPMRLDELRELARHPLIRIGGHTRWHQPLPSLSPAAQRDEIEVGRRDLERLIGRPVTTFSYPYGRHDRVTSAIVRELPFELACTSRPAPLTAVARRFTLPRLQVVEAGGDAFSHWLNQLFPSLARQVAHA